MREAPVDGHAHGPIDGVPRRGERRGHLLPRQALGPPGEEPGVGVGQSVLAGGPREGLDPHAATVAAHAAHGVEEDHGDVPQGHEVEAPDRLRVVARGPAPAVRAPRAGPGAGPYPDLGAQPRVLHQPHRLVDERRSEIEVRQIRHVCEVRRVCHVCEIRRVCRVSGSVRLTTAGPPESPAGCGGSAGATGGATAGDASAILFLRLRPLVCLCFRPHRCPVPPCRFRMRIRLCTDQTDVLSGFRRFSGSGCNRPALLTPAGCPVDHGVAALPPAKVPGPHHNPAPTGCTTLYGHSRTRRDAASLIRRAR